MILYKPHTVHTIAEVNALALDSDRQRNGAYVIYNGETCDVSLPYATRNETVARWYCGGYYDGQNLADGDEVTVLVPIEAMEQTDEDYYYNVDGTRTPKRRLVTPWTPAT